MDEAGIETAYVTDNPFLIGPRFERFRRTLDISKSIFEQGEYRSWNVGIDKRPRGLERADRELPPPRARRHRGREADQGERRASTGGAGRPAVRRARAEGRHGGAARAEGQAAVLPGRRRIRPARGLERAHHLQAALRGPRGRRADPALQDAVLEGRGPRRDGGAGRARARAVRRRADLHRRLDRPPAEPARRPGAGGQDGRLLPVGPRHPARRARPDGQGELDARQGDPRRAVHHPPPGGEAGRRDERLLRLHPRRGAHDAVLPGHHRARAGWTART